uniref:DUF3110 domain-containing protein n=1 Tax=Kaarinaea lacus PCC 9237 TaxID=3158555 RepID=U5TSQ1_9CYAN|nr:hypothetical protein [Nostoc sp. 152]
MRVFVLIFNANTDNEGIHTIRIGDRKKILMFESQDDALRFALLLEAQDFLTPTVELIDDEEIKEFCESADYDWELVRENSDLAIPPEINVKQTEWQSEAENKDTGGNTLDSKQIPQDEPELSDSELDKIRRQLEGLL